MRQQKPTMHFAGVALALLAALATPAALADSHEYEVPLFLAAATEGRQGFVRLINRSQEAGTVTVTPIDDAGVEGDHIRASLEAGQTVHFNSNDLENGNPGKPWLSSRSGAPSQGDWRLRLDTELTLEVLAYVRTAGGFLTTMHETVGVAGQSHEVAFFNPGSNPNQVSRLRLINVSDAEAAVSIVGYDDSGAQGAGGEVGLTLAPGAARTVSALELEAGAMGLAGALGDGAGKWRLYITADQDILAMSLLDAPADQENPGGYLTNLSATAPSGDILLFPRDGHPAGLQGFARIVNRASRAGTVTIHAIGEDGARRDPVMLTLAAGEAKHFNSRDIAFGNAGKGLSGGVGASEVDWRLELSADVAIEPLAYIRTPDGFVTSMHDHAPLAHGRHEVVTFNPASNTNQVSRLRVINPGAEDAAVTIDGVDDSGAGGAAAIAVTVAAGQAVTLTAQDLENGMADDGAVAFTGALGDGTGKWRLHVAADQPIQVMSLLHSRRSGNLTNLSSRMTAAQTQAVFVDAVDPAWAGGIFGVDSRDWDAAYGDGAIATNKVQWEVRDADERDAERGQVLDVTMLNDGNSGVWYIAAAPDTSIDLSAYRTGSLRFDINVLDYGANANGLKYKVDCVWPCTSGERDLGKVGDGAWETVTVPVSALVDGGLNLATVNTGLALVSPMAQASDLSFQLDNIRWVAGTPAPPVVPTDDPNRFVLFDDEVFANTDGLSPAWELWDCCGAGTFGIEDDDGDRAHVVELSWRAGATVTGFRAKDSLDVRELQGGTLQFDMKAVSPPPEGAVWLLKVEAPDGATPVEVELALGDNPTPNEAWQSYAFTLDEDLAGLDKSAVKLVLIFPTWDMAEGAVARIDNVRFVAAP